MWIYFRPEVGEVTIIGACFITCGRTIHIVPSHCLSSCFNGSKTWLEYSSRKASLLQSTFEPKEQSMQRRIASDKPSPHSPSTSLCQAFAVHKSVYSFGAPWGPRYFWRSGSVSRRSLKVSSRRSIPRRKRDCLQASLEDGSPGGVAGKDLPMKGRES